MQARSEILQRIKIPAEDELLDRILSHPLYRREFASASAAASDENYARFLADQLRSGAEVTRTGHEALFRMVDEASATLKLSVSTRLFKSPQPSGSENAVVVASGDRVIIAFQSGILNTVSDPTLLRTIVGHELGHHGFGHLETNAPYEIHSVMHQALDAEGAPGRRSRDDAVLVRLLRSAEFEELVHLASLWRQLSELNADRAGMVVEPNLMASIEAEMLLAGGAADAFGRYEPQGYLTQARELIAHQHPPFDMSDVESTHPLGPCRALALEFFYCTDLFRELTGHGPGTQRAGDFPKILPSLVPVGVLKPRLTSSPRGSSAHPFLAATTQGAHPGRPSPAPSPRAQQAPPTHSVAEADGGDSLALSSEDDAQEVAVFTEPASGISERDRAELTCLLAYRIVMSDGKATRGEEAFVASLIRPRALSDEVVGALARLSEDQLDARERELTAKGREMHGRSKTALIKMMIQAAKADRKITDEEVTAILGIARDLDASETAHRELRNVFGSRVEHLLTAG